MSKLKRLYITATLFAIAVIASVSFIYYIIGSKLSLDAQIDEQERDASFLLRVIEHSFINRIPKEIVSLPTSYAIQDVLNKRLSENSPALRTVLNTLRRVYNSDFVYVINTEGITIASTISSSGMDIKGNNYSFRPYFQNAMKGEATLYYAVGVTTKKRGIYFSTPVKDKHSGSIIGVLVISMGMEKIDEMLKNFYGEAMLVTDKNIVFSASDTNHIFSVATENEISFDEKQFSDIDFKKLPFYISNYEANVDGVKTIVRKINLNIASMTNWHLITIRKYNPNYKLPKLRSDILWQGYISSVVITIIALVAFFLGWRLRILHNELKQQAEDLKRSNADLEQFAYSASHDLKEPLRIIRSYTELLEKDLSSSLNENTKVFMKYIKEGTERMTRLIDDLLAFSRVDKSDEEARDISIGEIIEQVIDNLKMRIKESEAKIEYSTLPYVLAHETTLIQLFQNLLSNAIKFRKEEPLVIKISATTVKDFAVFRVEDNGIGIEEKYLETVFQIFRKLHPRSKYEGSGIGLSLCKKIVERYGGEIRVESEEGKGSTFIFTLPLSHC